MNNIDQLGFSACRRLMNSYVAIYGGEQSMMHYYSLDFLKVPAYKDTSGGITINYSRLKGQPWCWVTVNLPNKRKEKHVIFQILWHVGDKTSDIYYSMGIDKKKCVQIIDRFANRLEGFIAGCTQRPKTKR